MNIVDLGVMPYSEALAVQLECHERVRQGEEDTLSLVEHPPVITFGRHGGEENLLLGGYTSRNRAAGGNWRPAASKSSRQIAAATSPAIFRASS